MNRVITGVIGMCMLVALTGCFSTYGQQGAGAGAAGGAVLGQMIGRNTEATLIGAAIGGLLGYIAGNEMDKYDRQNLNQAYEYGPTGVTQEWQNPDTGYQYQVTPQRPYEEPRSNQVCRKAEISSVIDGRAETVITTACRNDQGQWVLQ